MRAGAHTHRLHSLGAGAGAPRGLLLPLLPLPGSDALQCCSALVVVWVERVAGSKAVPVAAGDKGVDDVAGQQLPAVLIVVSGGCFAFVPHGVNLNLSECGLK